MEKDFSDIIQIGVIVPDAQTTARNLERLLGWKSARSLETMRIPGRFYHGVEEDFGCLMLFYQFAHMELEIIQPLRGPSCWESFMVRSGQGIHHLLFDLASSGDSIAELSHHGIEIEQRGRALPYGEHAFWAYATSHSALGFTMELINRRENPIDLPKFPSVSGPFSRFQGVSISTMNLEQTMHVWSDVLGWTPDGASYRIFSDAYRGAGSSALSGAASYRLPNLQIELVRPVCGKSCASNNVSLQGGGIYCITFSVDGTESIHALTKKGVAILEQGHSLFQNQILRWTMLDTLELFGFYMKVVYP